MQCNAMQYKLSSRSTLLLTLLLFRYTIITHHHLLYYTAFTIAFAVVSCWYWEVVEACRKLLLTAVLSIVATGPSVR